MIGRYHKVFVCVLSLICFVRCRNLPNNTAVLISKYAKVAYSGTNNTKLTPEVFSARRYSDSSSYWPQSTNSNHKYKNHKPGVSYQYAVYRNPEEVRTENVPGIGEVIIQDRFEPRPLFAHRKKQQSQISPTYLPPAPPSSVQQPPPPAASSSFDSFPTFDSLPPQKQQSTEPPPPEPATTSKPPVDLYTSPYSSYNPPNNPTANSQLSFDSYPPYAPPSSDDDNNDASVTMPPEGYSSFGPPLAPNINIEEQTSSSSITMSKQNSYGPPNYPPQSEDDVYYPPGDYDHQMNGQPPPAQPSMDMMGSMDMVPPAPAPDDHVHGNSFPQYLYDNHHYDHHVYEEIPHTTTAAPVDQKRVSTSHYSYYYLGRKLWYVPLYFSIYFIIYVTVLILKSIARHKVQFKYNWVDHNSSRSSRQLNVDDRLSDLHRNVSQAIENVSKKYEHIAMK